MNEYTLKYKKSATMWEESLPLGNGKLGACVFGRTDTELIRLNEETLWEGFEHEWNNPETKAHLDEIRALVFDEKYDEAYETACKYFTCLEQGSRMCAPGEPFGTFRGAGDIVLVDHRDNELIERRLDILHGTAYTFTKNYTAAHFVSYKANVIVNKIEAVSGTLDMDIRYDHNGGGADNDKGANSFRSENWDGTEVIKNTDTDFENVTVNGNEFLFSEQLKGDGALFWAIRINVVSDGLVFPLKDGINVKEATYIHIYSSVHTTYNTDDPLIETAKDIKKALNAETLLEDNENWFFEQMTRATLDLMSDNCDAYTDERIKNIQNGNEDIGFAELYFNFGKYLLISSSAKGCTLPANLQGIWTKDNTPPWSADYHININLQMNYWHAEALGLSDCADSFFKYIEFLKKHGTATARDMFGLPGWVSFHATTVHGYTAPGNSPLWGSFSTGGAWCITHIFEHYRYTLDKEFLKKYWSAVKECAEFFLSYLVKDPNTGYLVTCPSNSPENHFIDPKTGKKVGMYAGPTMDNQILRDLFEGILEFKDIAEEKDEKFLSAVKNTLKQLTPTRIGKYGIMEWQKDYEEAEPGHRHISQLYGLFPSSQINKNTPDLLEAARKTIERRLSYGGGHTGWSKAWIINFYARLYDGEKAYEELNDLFAKGTLANMFDKHPPFQIDGNFGGCAGIVNMLLNASGDEPELLPALPKAWKNGELKNFRIKGNKTVSCSWRDGKITKKEIKNLWET